MAGNDDAIRILDLFDMESTRAWTETVTVKMPHLKFKSKSLHGLFKWLDSLPERMVKRFAFWKEEEEES